MLEWVAKFYDVIGIIGVVIILISYLLLNMNKLSSANPIYPISNACGSCMIFISLMYDWNLASVVIEAAWISISLYGVYRTLCKTNL